ncbi:MAG: DUF1566 domain-containing protein [Desulfobacterales bacterium]|nr:DUF1566 domain-containing protein [Desulfobacterales bacterium]
MRLWIVQTQRGTVSWTVKVRPGRARTIFAADELWRPLVYVQNDFITTEKNTVIDRTTGLIWQQAGSDYPLTWQEAHTYIKKLNTRRFGGYAR